MAPLNLALNYTAPEVPDFDAAALEVVDYDGDSITVRRAASLIPEVIVEVIETREGTASFAGVILDKDETVRLALALLAAVA